MTKDTSTALVPASSGFDYEKLDSDVRKKAKETTELIRQATRTSLLSAVEAGKHLLEMKEVLEHGQFGEWMKAEFPSSQRLLQHFMNVAERLGPKSEMISELMQPTTAYLLAAPSTPDKALKAVFKEAEKGKEITMERAKEIVAKYKEPKERKAPTVKSVCTKLEEWVERYRERWNTARLAALVKRLREMADKFEKEADKKDEKKSAKAG